MTEVTKDAASIDLTKLPSVTPDTKLGTVVVDLLSGLTGALNSKNEKLSGNIQFGIQPMGGGAVMPDTVWVDYQTLVIHDSGVSDRVPAPDNTVTVKLGEAVEDVVSGVKGVATDKVTFINGCVVFGVQPKVDKDGKLPDTIYLDHKRLKTTNAGVSEDSKKPVKRSDTGGPATRGIRPR